MLQKNMHNRSSGSMGQRLKSLRKSQFLTLVQLAEKSGVSASAISKIENGVTSPTYDVVEKLSFGLGVKLGELFSNTENTTTPKAKLRGWQVVEKRGEADMIETENYTSQYLCSKLKTRSMMPSLTRLKARSIEEFGPLIEHSGEEYLYVLEGKVALHSAFYSVVELEVGDSAYLDSTMGHAYISTSEEPAVILCVCLDRDPVSTLQNLSGMAANQVDHPEPAEN